jgi:hypothetical protein
MFNKMTQVLQFKFLISFVRFAHPFSRAKKEAPLSPGERQRRFLEEANNARERKRSAASAREGAGDGHEPWRRRGNSVDPARTLMHRKSAPPLTTEFPKGLRAAFRSNSDIKNEPLSTGCRLEAATSAQDVTCLGVDSMGFRTSGDCLLTAQAQGKDDSSSRRTSKANTKTSLAVELGRHVSCVNLPSRALSPTWALTSIWRSASGSSEIGSCSPRGSHVNLSPSSTGAWCVAGYGDDLTAVEAPARPKLKRRVSAWETVKRRAQKSISWLTARSEESLLDKAQINLLTYDSLSLTKDPCSTNKKTRRRSSGAFLPLPSSLSVAGVARNSEQQSHASTFCHEVSRSLPGSPGGATATAGVRRAFEERSATLPERDFADNQKSTLTLPEQEPKHRKTKKSRWRLHKAPKQGLVDASHRTNQEQQHHHHCLPFAGLFHKLRKSSSEGGSKSGGLVGQQPAWVVVEFPQTSLLENASNEEDNQTWAGQTGRNEQYNDKSTWAELTGLDNQKHVGRKEFLAKAKSTDPPPRPPPPTSATTSGQHQRKVSTEDIKVLKMDVEQSPVSDDVFLYDGDRPPLPPHQKNWTSAEISSESRMHSPAWTSSSIQVIYPRDQLPAAEIEKRTAGDGKEETGVVGPVPITISRKRRTLTRSPAINPLASPSAGQTKKVRPTSFKDIYEDRSIEYTERHIHIYNSILTFLYNSPHLIEN